MRSPQGDGQTSSLAARRASSAGRRARRASEPDLLQLQSLVGNRAVAGLVDSGATGLGHIVQRLQAKGGTDEVNPEFFNAKDANDRLEFYYKLKHTAATAGIASKAVLDGTGALWAVSAAPEGKERVYKTPVFKDKKRGWQANYWERPEGGGKETHNYHISMKP